MSIVCATTAQFPGVSFDTALEHIRNGVEEGIWGALSSKHVQLCPQSAGVLTEERAEYLSNKYSSINIRLHANVRVFKEKLIFDMSTWSKDRSYYYQALADRMLRLGANMFSLHAGYHSQCPTLENLWDNIEYVRDCVQKASGGQVDVAVEGLYPSSHQPQWLSSWQEYELLLSKNIPFAIDLSHLKIVAKKENIWKSDLVRDLLSSPLCVEIHVSDNDGLRDRHHQTHIHPVWMDDFKNASIGKQCVVFSEGNLIPKRDKFF